MTSLPPDTSLRADATALLRVLDAAGNRAREALRVVEDFARFVLDDRFLTECCKQLRHDLTAALAPLCSSDRLGARETQADVGTSLTTPAEQHRRDTMAVLEANIARLQEALRSLEEFGKVHDPQMGARFETLRYRSYTLHRAMVLEGQNTARLSDARLYVVLDGRPTAAEFEALVGSLVAAGVHVLQLRDKQLDDRQLLDRARLLVRLTHGTKALAIVNDRVDLARLAHADGVHVGQEELTVKDARTVLGPRGMVGASTHAIEQARQAVLDGASYLGVGPTFPSGTKQFQSFPGLELVRAVADEIRLPAFAIGGINLDNLEAVLAAGASRVAVSGAIVAARDPAAVARQMLEKIKTH